jgi:site-specific DNA recombinase
LLNLCAALLFYLAGRGAEVLANSEADDFGEVAEAISYSTEHAADLLKVSYLAPDIIAAILDGRQPAGLTRTKLIRWPGLPMDWSQQRIVLGFV